MKKKKIPSLLIAAPKSGSGKTTVTTALMGALVKRGRHVCGYKTGPDYIDLMFHRFVTGVPGRNLDSYMCDEETVKYLYADSFDGDIAVIEGAMGYYDGVGATSSASAYDIAKITGVPVILVLEVKGAARSVAAMVKGFCELEKDSGIKGVILNNIKSGMYEFYREIVESTGVHVYGYMPHIDEAEIVSRHLGLLTADEVAGLEKKIDVLTECALETLDIDGILALAGTVAEFEYNELTTEKEADVTIGVACDKAFCFYYEDNLRLLEKLGANLKYISPLADTEIEGIDGLYIGGGYPEVYAQQLSANTKFIQSVKTAAKDGMPVYGECGGFMYLLERFCDKDGNVHDMCGLIKGESKMGDKLCRFGYIELTANSDSVMCDQGTTVRGHEFHYSDSTNNGSTFNICRPNGRQWKGIYSDGNICAGYPHIHFYSNTEFARGFVKRCASFRAGEIDG